MELLRLDEELVAMDVTDGMTICAEFEVPLLQSTM